MYGLRVCERMHVSYPGNPALRKQEKASDLHLATASHVSIWMAIDLAWICSIMDGERQFRLVMCGMNLSKEDRNNL